MTVSDGQDQQEQPNAADAAAGAPTPPPAEATPPADATPSAAAAPPAAEKPAPTPVAARPAKEAEPKEAPRVPPPAGSINEVLAEAAGVALKAYMVPSLQGEAVAVEVSRDDLVNVMTAARDDPRLDLSYLRCLSGVDWQEEGLEVVYHLWSFTKYHALTVKTRVGADDAVVPTMSGLWPAANWHEREARDMFGIVFEGHPNLVPLLLPDDMTDHFPLRKDNPLQEIEEWQGVNLREGAGEGEE